MRTADRTFKTCPTSSFISASSRNVIGSLDLTEYRANCA